MDNEKDIEKILVSEVKNLGGRAYKWVSPGNAGVPDRIVILPNRLPVFVELKTDKGTLSKLQRVQIRRLKDLGQYVFVAYGTQGVADFFDEIGYQEVADKLRGKEKTNG